MSVTIEDTEIDFQQLTRNCTEELNRYRRREVTDDHFCRELLRLATLEQVDQAWSALQQMFSEILLIWLRGHPVYSQALLYDSEDNYIAQTFSRFWVTTRERRPEFLTLATVLTYLHSTLNSLLIDTLRMYIRSTYVSSLDFEVVEALFSTNDEPDDQQEVWMSIQGLLIDESERWLVYLLYYCGLKPREIATRFPTLFRDVQDIYRQNHNIIQRLRRQRDRIRWLLSSEEVASTPSVA